MPNSDASQPADTLPDIWVRAHPFGTADNKDAHGEYFDARTKFYDDLLPVTPISYYHNRTPDGAPMGEPIAIGITAGRQYVNPVTGEIDGRWDKAQFFDDVSQDIKERIAAAIEKGTLRSSPTVTPDFHSVERDGHIKNWLTASIAIFDAEGMRQPANPRAIGIAQMKSLFQAAHLEFPETLMKAGGGNPNHDADGKFSSGGGSGDKESENGGSSDESQDEEKGLDNSDRIAEVTSLASQIDKARGVVKPSKLLGELKPKANAIKREVLSFLGLPESEDGFTGASPERAKIFQKLSYDLGSYNATNNTGEWARIVTEHSKPQMRGKYATEPNQQKAAPQGDSMASTWAQNARTAFDNLMKALSAKPTDAAKPNKQSDDDDAEKESVWKEFVGELDEDDTDDADENDTAESDTDKAKTKKPDGELKPENAKEKKKMADTNADDLRLEYEKQQNQMKAMQLQNAELVRRLDGKDLDAWFDEQLRAGKVMPAEKAQIVEMALQLKADDVTPATMKAADGQAQPSRLNAFKATIEGRQPMLNLDGTMKAAGFDSGAKDGDKPSPERIAELLSKTSLGAQVAAEKNGKN